ncbi:hypothetical protein GZ77_06600 [Endozoicomonas montiporae]|uniref:Amidinotransferase n=2 Tax=Endozoicomonas montiporae TaxID=1027273 RepID=A0A081N6P8_9GAMM|nr:arginine deiminase-related protein [Endozoicomonas montiporae]AMO56451.1 hypothetical protein EZMO1_2356 [Endozoicomonas montiporae CL-33]KEQ14121.1 hypothetical protein GZ77_06600 [Endozoicomonas montiporae]
MKQLALAGLFIASTFCLQQAHADEALTSYVVMVPPNHFAETDRTKPSTSKNKPLIRHLKEEGSVSVTAKAMQEYTAAKEQLEQHQVHVIELPATHSPNAPGAAFPNNWFISFPSPCPQKVQCGTTGNTQIDLFPMLTKRKKKTPDIKALRKALNMQGISSQYNDDALKDVTGHQALEGSSSIVLDRKNKVMFAALSPRTDALLLQAFANRQDYKLISFRTLFQDQPVYHTNMMMSIGERFAVLCSECISEENHRRQVLEALSDKTIIDITPDQTTAYAGNLVPLKNDQGETITVLSRTAFQTLNDEQLRALNRFNDHLLVFDLPVIETFGGGSAGCMLAEIFFQPKQYIRQNHSKTTE